MGRPVIYLHTEQSYYLNNPKVTIRDICSVYCKDRNVPPPHTSIIQNDCKNAISKV